MPVSWKPLAQILLADELAIFNLIVCGERPAPKDPDSIDFVASAEINHDPLGIERVSLFRKVFIQIRITFPKTLVVAIINARIAVVVCLIERIPSSRQPVAVANIDRWSEVTVGRPIALSPRWIALATNRVPMPRFPCQLGSQT